MERVAWTDERLDELCSSHGRRIRAQMDRESSGPPARDRRARALQARDRVGGGIIVGLIGVIAAVFANGG